MATPTSPTTKPTLTFSPSTNLLRRNSDKGSCANFQSHPHSFLSLRRPDAIKRYSDLDEEYHKRKRRFGTTRRKSIRRKKLPHPCFKYLPFSFFFKTCKFCCGEKKDNYYQTTNYNASNVVPATIAVANCECQFPSFQKNISMLCVSQK